MRAAAADVRHALRDVDGLHLTPPEWLHVTVLLLGTTDDIGDAPMADATADVADALRGLPPIVPTRRFTIDTVSLVVQSGPERSWIWETAAPPVTPGRARGPARTTRAEKRFS